MGGHTGAPEPRGRWWRRGRDAALAQARSEAAAAREAAAAAMLALDAELSGLSEDVAAHEDAGTARVAAQRPPAADPVVQQWQELSTRTDAVIGRYLAALSAADPAQDDDVVRVRTTRDALGGSARALHEVLPLVRDFRARHAGPLGSARGARTLGPRRLAEAEAAVARARAALAAAGEEVTDPALGRDLDAAVRAAREAGAALAAGRPVTGGAAAERARAGAESVAARAASLPARAADVRRGAASVRTRREALGTRHARLAPVMSELRRRYTHRAWADVERAPERAAAALAEVDDALDRLAGLLAAPPLDVPAAALALEQVRGASARVDQEIASATGRLEELDAVATDPGRLLGGVERDLVDARRFLAALPEGRGERYRSTFDNLARRLRVLETEVRGHRPDWGHVVTEARSIEQGLAAMVRTARVD
ncbi:hypothetical protein [Geodermatophilus marinus]|uniref:hypothetical protein n=1 Tax=Geodermatophilus sp. LHW52908 TaxID=2303986 RepID=UPI000E3E8F84|nr:hypothetical protein [Geodermatophilus sp. LHW52908]RFU19288.1 hypothetical protein D0Z06_22160 [Geodermatophilus sp. LHW52908]